jgi:hypothetical protein
LTLSSANAAIFGSNQPAYGSQKIRTDGDRGVDTITSSFLASLFGPTKAMARKKWSRNLLAEAERGWRTGKMSMTLWKLSLKATGLDGKWTGKFFATFFFFSVLRRNAVVRFGKNSTWTLPSQFMWQLTGLIKAMVTDQLTFGIGMEWQS